MTNSEYSKYNGFEMHMLRLFGKEQSYWTANGALLAFGASLITFAFSPTLSLSDNPALELAEQGISVASAISCIGIVLHVFNNRSFLARWCYLILCFATSLTVVSFSAAQLQNEIRLQAPGVGVVMLMLLTGGLIAFSMHVSYGGRRDVIRIRVRQDEEND